MAVGLRAPARLYPVQGLRLGALRCGIKANRQVKDLALVEIQPGSSVAAVFTRSHFCAAPVILCKQHLALQPSARYLLVNSGNANAATGQQGLDNARSCCAAVAAAGNVKVEDVLPFSTGVIAEQLAVEPIVGAIPDLVDMLDPDGWLSTAEAIMTTDTLPKAISVQLNIDDRPVTITGIAKGSGMIKPDMATMLCFVGTDARIEPQELSEMLDLLVASSFNCITVDGDTSTNDSCVLIATGAADVKVDRNHRVFFDALQELFEKLAQAIIRDAEGATKFVTVSIEGAVSVADARCMGFTIAESPLVKTALFASDPNWGRFIMAIGRSPVESIDIDRIDLYLGAVRLLHNGLPDPDYRETLGQAEMSRDEISISVNLNLGDASARIWTSDLSYEYVKINAEYRS
ncbi:MAG: bifunctional glutamate N-acetyltransferase/amino-acid acetyltransferase ArgJ [Gammaproteobacteria bacterium]|nr:bifunctional glutamate N-acetyltransferase/amino-acid acetyltransferase ArgJ [Gammaproteobacteria bacterium]